MTEFEQLKSEGNLLPIRYRSIPASEGDTDYEFEIYTRPFWLGWFRKKRWEPAITTNDFYTGYEFCDFLLN